MTNFEILDCGRTSEGGYRIIRRSTAFGNEIVLLVYQLEEEPLRPVKGIHHTHKDGAWYKVLSSSCTEDVPEIDDFFMKSFHKTDEEARLYWTSLIMSYVEGEPNEV